MKFDLMESTFSLFTLVPLIFIFSASAKSSPYGSVSLPCITMLTSFIYFYLMPVLTLAAGDDGFFGMYILTLEKTHFVVALYVIGAGVAFLANWRVLSVDPSLRRDQDREIPNLILGMFWSVAVLGIVVQMATGRLNLTGAEDYQQISAEGISQFAFLAQTYNFMVPLTLVALIRERFSTRSLLFLMVVLVIFLQAGFRFRIMIMLAAIVTAYALMHRKRIGLLVTLGGVVIALALVNVIGAIRRYGSGVDLDNLNNIKSDSLFSSFGGELGIVYVLNYTAENPLPELVTFDPWLVGVARLIPSFIWSDKPSADYLRNFIAGTTIVNADKAGIAAPQHVEMLYQFGWFGLPILAFLYFGLACLIVGRLLNTTRETRIAGCALAPAFFGYYMQTRGYFFQVFSDGLFMFGPLFLLNQSAGGRVEKVIARLRNVRRTIAEGRPQL
ncbi:MAG: hypothetical protein ABL901_15245 [Hyphomicrobiaceae bacterium]